MTLTKLLAGLGATAMLLGIIYAIAAGGAPEAFMQIIALPAGQVTVLDLYIGFALFCGWVFYREKSPVVAGLFTLATLGLGNLLTCAYVVWVAQQSGGDWRKFWLGHRA